MNVTILLHDGRFIKEDIDSFADLDAKGYFWDNVDEVIFPAKKGESSKVTVSTDELDNSNMRTFVKSTEDNAAKTLLLLAEAIGLMGAEILSTTHITVDQLEEKLLETVRNVWGTMDDIDNSAFIIPPINPN